jgi:hypothetical protein
MGCLQQNHFRKGFYVVSQNSQMDLLARRGEQMIDCSHEIVIDRCNTFL